MKKLLAIVLSVGLIFGSQVLYADNIAVLDLVQNSRQSTAAFAGDRLATVNLKNSPDFKKEEVKQSDKVANVDPFIAANHNLIPEKVELKGKNFQNKQYGLELRSHNLFYLTLLP